MLLPHPAVAPAELLTMLVSQFGQPSESPAFVPVGGDSWCYRARPYWITVRRDRQRHVPEAYEAAIELQEQGLAFVCAPLRGRDGNALHSVAGLPVAVLPYLDGEPIRSSDPPTEEEEVCAVEMVRSLHEARVSVELPVEDFAFPHASELNEAIRLALVDGIDHVGPFGSRIRNLVDRNQTKLEELLSEAATIANYCQTHFDGGVLTHGEPDGGNILRFASGLRLIDWGDLYFAPPERDWVAIRAWLRIDGDFVRTRFVRFYGMRWVLGEIYEYVDRLVHSHSGDEEDERAWKELSLYLQ